MIHPDVKQTGIAGFIVVNCVHKNVAMSFHGVRSLSVRALGMHLGAAEWPSQIGSPLLSGGVSLCV